MISKKMESALNVQAKNEFFSAYLYISMGAYFKRLTLPGFAHWTLLQAQEENQHALRFMNYIIDRGGSVSLNAIEKPKSSWQSPQEVFEDIVKHERKVSESINKLVEMAHSENDYATSNMLQWFVKEQVEEESSTAEILAMLKDYIKDSKTGLLFLDKKLAKRTLD